MNAAPDSAERPPRGIGRRRIGVALGSGSARGLAHIGVMRAIVEAGLRVDVVAGTSMGAFVGAIFAAGRLDRLEADFRGFDWSSIAALVDPVFPRSGLIDGRRIGDFMRSQVDVTKVEELPIPFRAIATDITSGEAVAIGSGDLIEAVRASIAVPGIFTPIRSEGRILVDGGLVEPVPVGAARALGADLVIAVDLNHDIVPERSARVAQEASPGALTQAVTQVLASLDSLQSPALAQLREWLEREPLPGILDVLLASIYIMQARITQATLAQDRPEVLIQPSLGAVRFMAFDRAEEIVEAGYRAARQALEDAAPLLWPA
ncbi:MAG: patatin-like phospholipase family protein [Burkholderiaceae bacterium]